ncbi:hypothetical protein [Flavobacterium stagni]|uniref:Lipoprotein n=1 Tax=Flavobacterium stagni TaxID=2506421 RepID=A0A4Q1KCJ8_9FLAO|nr:hypothetical protein [Flavobacterium stagni]RXR24657.1 hypothetical protein EQG61_04210 [Flavobacterium stagni]
MRKLSIFATLLVTFLLFSCSNSENSSSSGQSQNVVTFTSNSVAKTVTSFQARKSENTIAITAVTSDGYGLEINFNKFGDLNKVSTYNLMGSESNTSHINFTSHYFTFNMTSIDESNKIVKGDFTGRLYENENDLSSPYVTVSGNFDVVYTEVTPTVPNLECYAKIAGQDWYSTKGYQNNGFGMDDFIMQNLSDDDVLIGMGFNSTNNGPGVYNFTPSSTTNFVHFSKFNTTTLEYDLYNCTGTMTVVSKTPAIVGYIIDVNYSLTAVNPANSSQSIQITNGHYKDYYSW